MGKKVIWALLCWAQFHCNERFIKGYNENSDEGYFLKVDVEYPKKLLNFHMDLPFLPERKQIKKCNKLPSNIQDKENYVTHIRAFETINWHEY